MSIYWKHAEIKHGESIASTHPGSKNWIEIGSIRFGAGRSISTPTGMASKREASLATVSEVTLTKLADSTTPLIFQEAVVGKPGLSELELTQTGTAGEAHIFMKIKLTDAMISSHSISSSGDRPQESLSLNFVKIEVEYQGLDHAGKVASGLKKNAHFDLGKVTAK